MSASLTRLAQLLFGLPVFQRCAGTGIGNFLRIPGRPGQKRCHLGRDLIGDAIGVRTGLIGGGNKITEHRRLIRARFHDHGFDALGGDVRSDRFSARASMANLLAV